MSNRIRVLLNHAEYGPHMGGKALRIVEQRFDNYNQKRANKFLQPALFTSWPRWKRCLWMARKLGVNWRFQVFREPRGTNANKAAFWRAAEGIGFQRPKRHKKQAYKVEFVVRPRQQGRRAGQPGPGPEVAANPPRIRNLAELLQDANQFHWDGPVNKPEVVDGLIIPAANAIRGGRNQADVGFAPDPVQPLRFVDEPEGGF